MNAHTPFESGTTPTDAELVRRVVAGDADAFEPLIARSYPSVLRLCRRLLDTTSEAEDIAQEAALQAFLSLAQLDAPERFSAWLHAIAANLARMALRRTLHLRTAIDEHAGASLVEVPHAISPEDVYLAREMHDTIIAALNALSPVNREVVIRFYLQGMRYAELADLLGVPVSAVKGRLFHGRRSLRQALHSLTPEPATFASIDIQPWRLRFSGRYVAAPPDAYSRARTWQWHFEDDRGDECGRWYVTPIGGGKRRLVAPDLPAAYSTGIAIAAGSAVVGSASAEDGFSIHHIQPGASARLLYQHAERLDIAGLSSDESLLCFQHAAHGDWYHPALRVLDLEGQTVGELWDGPGQGIWAGAWSPLPGDQRLIVRREQSGMLRPAIWTSTIGALQNLPIDLPGEIDARWYPDGLALLLIHELRGRQDLYRFDLQTADMQLISTPRGEIWAAGVLSDDTVWYGCDSAAQPPEVHVWPDPMGRVARTRLPAGVACTDVDVAGIHCLLVEPPGPRPHPTLVRVNSYPSTHFRDSYSPITQSWVDHGYAVIAVNARGSNGCGKAWRDAPIGNIGWTELADIAAVRDALVTQGIADPARLILYGEGWGGYLTLLGLGTQPDLWTLGIAEKPLADLPMCYEDVMDPLKAMMRAQFGGAPDVTPHSYQRSSPLTYVEQVRAPVLIIAGTRDARCPIRQVEHYVTRLRELDRPHVIHRYEGGFMFWETQERLRQMELQLTFAARHLATRSPR